MAVAVAVIGAVFGELVGSDAGLGHAIQVGTAQLETARVFAAVLILSMMAIALFGLVALLERRAVPWAHSSRERRVRGLRAPVAAVLALVAPSRPRRMRREVREPDGRPARHSLDLVLDWFPNPDHVAIYEARAKGYFDQVGLDVKPHVPSDPAAPIKQVAAGRADLAISYEPEVLLAREQGLPVVAVAALVQRPLTSLIATRKSGVRSVRRPARKAGRDRRHPVPVGLPEDDPATRARPASSVKETNVGASLLPAMLSGKVDATLGGFWNVEGVELRPRGTKPWIEPVDKLGVPDYDELVLVANSDKLDGERDDLRLFISAVARGASEARKRPRAAQPRAARREPRPEAQGDHRRASASRFRRCFPRSGTPLGLPGSRRLAELRRLDGVERRVEGAARTSTRPLRTSCCRARGSSSELLLHRPSMCTSTRNDLEATTLR